jgi:hypothetical protein
MDHSATNSDVTPITTGPLSGYDGNLIVAKTQLLELIQHTNCVNLGQVQLIVIQLQRQL